MSPRWFIGLLTLYVLCILIGNWVQQGTTMLSAADTADLAVVTDSAITETKDTTNSVLVFVNTSRQAISKIVDAMTFNFAFFYEYDAATGTIVPNIWMNARYAILIPIGFGLLLSLILTFIYRR